MKAAELFVRCLENEGVETMFGIPGEENLDVMDALLDSPVRFITTRHEQGAAFMADVRGRLTGKAGVCLATLGPGATNLVTGVADANMDRAPVVAIAGQAATTRMHKESHQVLDLTRLFDPVSKYSTQIREPEIIPEIVSKAFKVAEVEKPGACFIEFPENIAGMDIPDMTPLNSMRPELSVPAESRLATAIDVLESSKRPIIMAGNGVIRAHACARLVACAERLNIPVATTFMAKGAMPFSHPLSLGTVGLQARDYVSCGFDCADVIICVGYDMVEYHPYLWNRNKDHRIVHVDTMPAEVDEHYQVEVGVVGDPGLAMDGIASRVSPRNEALYAGLRRTIVNEYEQFADDGGFPLKPQKIVRDLRQALNPEDIVISDVGAHKMWMARMYQAEQPNTCIISNGFASMGIALPGAIAAKMTCPECTIVAVTGDAGFLMNVQEIETAVRYHIPVIILIWHDDHYGLIQWKQMAKFGRESHVSFGNPDFIQLAESFGARGYRIEAADELAPALARAKKDDTVVIIDCPVDYSENMKLTEKLGELVCPI